MTLGILQGWVTNEGDAWTHTLDGVAHFFDRLSHLPAARRQPPSLPAGLLARARAPLPAIARETAGPYLEAAALLGRRTAELHQALASDDTDPAFAPEPFTRLDQRALYQSLRNLADASFELLRTRRDTLPEAARAQADHVLGLHKAVLQRFRRLVEGPLGAQRTRTHGDYHLGQVLWTGRDFVIIDFEGEPARPASIRRGKRSPLKDVAGMLRSYHYAAHQGLATHEARGGLPREQAALGFAWAEAWHGWVSAAFLGAYLATMRDAEFLPREDRDLEDLLVVHVLEKAVYELAYELNNRPAWVPLPLTGIAGLVEGSE